ncbi:MAG: Ldh family oxidoreductase, partial [Bacteroidota bacterium]
MIDTETEKTVNVKKEELRQFAINVLQSARVSPADARIIAEALLWSDLRARHPQGVSRLPIFVKRVQCGLINSPARLKWNRVAP